MRVRRCHARVPQRLRGRAYLADDYPQVQGAGLPIGDARPCWPFPKAGPDSARSAHAARPVSAADKLDVRATLAAVAGAERPQAGRPAVPLRRLRRAQPAGRDDGGRGAGRGHAGAATGRAGLPRGAGLRLHRGGRGLL